MNKFRKYLSTNKQLALAVVLLILAMCSLSCEKEDKSVYIPFIEIAKGGSLESEEIPKQDKIITTQEEWDDLKTAMGSSINSFSEIEIDFADYQIIAVFDEVHYSGGWNIDIECIRDYYDKIVVIVIAKYDGKGVQPTVITQPYHIVKIPVSIKKVEFKYR